MFRTLFKKKRIAFVAGVAAVAISGIAVAYFTGGSGSVKAPGTVGASTPWGITTGTPTWSGTLTALYPGASSDTEFLPFTVTNAGNGHQSLTSITATVGVATDGSGDAVTTSGSPIAGCLASWFTTTLDATNPALGDLAPGATYTGKVDLTMQNVNVSQDKCQSTAPAITITAS
jgi:hypothetical protein